MSNLKNQKLNISYHYAFEYGEFECNICKEKEGKFISINDSLLCFNCAFKKGLLSREDFLTKAYSDYDAWYVKNKRFGINPLTKEIEFTSFKQKFWWEKGPKTIRKTLKYRKTMKEYKEKHGNKCKICGKTDKVVIHHLLPVEKYFLGVFNFNNTICVCNSCHRKIHARFPKEPYSKYIIGYSK